MCNPKPDDRSDNAVKIKSAIKSTKDNIEAAKDMIAEIDNPKTKADLTAKNQRREAAMQGMAVEMKQELKHDKEQN